MAKPFPNLPIPDFLNLDKKLIPQQRHRMMEKHEDAYNSFCKWAALPEDLRNPRTQQEFEHKWGLPKNYTSKWKEKEDFQATRLKHFWNWMFDKYPDVIYAIYRRAVRNSATDARIFAELVGKKLETERPVAQISPFILVGVPQEKLDSLFVPKSYDKVVSKTIELNKVRDADIIETEKI